MQNESVTSDGQVIRNHLSRMTPFLTEATPLYEHLSFALCQASQDAPKSVPNGQLL